MHKTLHFNIEQLRPYINWVYFMHAWGLTGKPQAERQKMMTEANNMLDAMQQYRTHAIVGLYAACSNGDDIIVDGYRMPMLRQQHADDESAKYLCLADFVPPLQSGINERIGVFAATVDEAMEHDFCHDDYEHMLAQTIADRLAEATAELTHLMVRRYIWGYAPDEHLTIDELHKERFQGIRPAVGYPSMPDTSLNFIIDNIINMKSIGIRLTQSGAMKPHASVSGLMIAHPEAHYFDVGKIGNDQLCDYARRRGVPIELMRRFLASRLQ